MKINYNYPYPEYRVGEIVKLYRVNRLGRIKNSDISKQLYSITIYNVGAIRSNRVVSIRNTFPYTSITKTNMSEVFKYSMLEIGFSNQSKDE